MDTPLIVDKEYRNLYNLGSKIKWISKKEQGMAGKGRPTVDDKRDNQYRVRLNDEENLMLAYCSEKTGQPKSQIFRRALESYFQTVQLNELEIETDGISMKRVIKCPHCGASNAIDLADYSTGDYESERQMGPEIQHCFDCKEYGCIGCGNTFRVEGYINEYPVGAYNFEEINVTEEQRCLKKEISIMW